MAKVVYFNNKGQIFEHVLLEKTTLGRHPLQTIQILDRVVSKEHAVINFESDGNYYLRDIGSRNGTKLNGVRIDGSPHKLKHNDEISLGDYTLRVILDDQPASPMASDFDFEPPISVPVSARNPSVSRFGSATTGSFTYKETKQPSGFSQGQMPVLGSSSQGRSVPFSHGSRFANAPQVSETLQLDNILPTVNNKATTDTFVLGPAAPVRHRLDNNDAFLPENKIADPVVLRRDYERLRIAAELSEQAYSEFDRDKLLKIIVDKIFQVFNADRAAIFLYDDQNNLQNVISQTREGRHIRDFKISNTLLEEVIHEKTAFLSGDALNDVRLSESASISIDNIRSTMCVPLLYSDGTTSANTRVLGVIYLDTQITKSAFVEKDLQILTGFARQAALNLRHSKLVDEMSRNIIARNNLRRIISPHLIDDVLSGKINLEKSGQRSYATVLFSDIRGFTSMTEQSQPENIVNMLNEYFEVMVELIFRHGGMLDKFVGDEIMAVWGVTGLKEQHAAGAVRCAIEMFSELKKLNQERILQNKVPIEAGIGIATGEMIAGYMGSNQAMSYTVIGDTVNLGARLCSAAGSNEILMNENTYLQVRQICTCTALPPIMVKGKSQPIQVYRADHPYMSVQNRH